jgi:DNA polymerase III alpha subunit (gram-positive type)
MRSKLSDKEGELYFSILSKIKYIFPKPHAIAYTTTAWRTAFYKVYYPKEFYSVLLTCHATVYDIWLMTLDPAAIIFRLESLLNTLNNYKNSEKELLSIIKVLEELEKEKKKIPTEKKITNIGGVLTNIKEKVNNSTNEKLRESLKKNGKV